MTAKEKAEELVNKFYCDIYWVFGNPKVLYESKSIEAAKRCALIAVDEIIESITHIYETYEYRDYWLQVKKEIEEME